MQLANKWKTLIIVCLGIFMSTLDGGILNIANPSIAEALSISLSAVQWVTNAYMLVITASLLMFGRLGDRLGMEKIYTSGFIVFTLGSLLCSLASSLLLLVAFRIVQALGASMMMATGIGIVSNSFPDNERGKALGITGSVVGIGNMAGPSLGGLLIEYFGWPSIFLINIPVGVIAVILAYRFMIPAAPSTDSVRLKFDAPGTLLLAATSILLVMGLSPDVNKAWLMIGLLLIPLFVVVEKRRTAPLINFELFKIKPFVYGNILGSISYVSHMLIYFLFPFYLQNVLTLSPAQAGLYMTIPPLIMAVTAPIAGNLSDRWGPSRLTSASFLIMALAHLTLSTVTLSLDSVRIFAGLILLGLGLGTFGSPNSSSIMGSIPPDQAGYAGGFIATVRNLSYSLGTALSVAIYAAVLQTNIAIGSASPSLMAIQTVYRIGAILCLAGLLLSYTTHTSRKKQVKNEAWDDQS